MSVKVISRRDLASVLHCSCEVQMDTADDDKIQQTILYHLNMKHAIAEIREMDYLQFRSDYERWSQGWLSAILDMIDM
jgi:predicted small metal-binding protein